MYPCPHVFLIVRFVFVVCFFRFVMNLADVICPDQTATFQTDPSISRPSEMDTSVGKGAGWSGYRLPGWLESLPGWLESRPGWLESLLGWLESLPGWLESLPGWLESLPGWLESRESLPGWLESLPG